MNASFRDVCHKCHQRPCQCIDRAAIARMAQRLHAEQHIDEHSGSMIGAQMIVGLSLFMALALAGGIVAKAIQVASQ